MKEDEKNYSVIDENQIKNEVISSTYETKGGSREKSSLSRVVQLAKRFFIGWEAVQYRSSLYSSSEHNLYLETEDKVKIGAFIYKPKNIDEKTDYYIVCHGKGCERKLVHMFIDFKSFAIKNNSVFIVVDYRSFGDSAGEYTIKGVNFDVLAAYKYLNSTFNTKNISIVGHSLGSVIALEYGRYAMHYANDSIPKKVFLLALFTSIVEVCKDYKLFKLFSYLVPSLESKMAEEFDYSSIDNAIFLKDTLYIFHGRNDWLVDYKHSEKIQEATGSFLKISDHSHVTLFTDSNVWQEIFEINKLE